MCVKALWLSWWERYLKKQEPPLEQTVVVYILTKLELGGAQKVCLALGDKLRERGVRTCLISGREGVLAETAAHSFDEVVLLDTLKREVSITAILNESRVFCTIITELTRLKRRYGTVVVHTHSTKAGILGRWAAWFVGIRTRVHTVHGFGFNDYQSWPVWMIQYFFEALTALITTCYVCVSTADVARGKKLLPRFSRKHTIIRAAVEHERFYVPARTYRATTSVTFGSVACFKPQKNMFDLLRAFHLVHKKYPQSRLEIVGDGVLRPRIEQWIADHQLSDAVMLHGWQHDVSSAVCSWDVFVLSSLWEGLPCAIVEARYARVPIIAYNVGGIADVVVHGQNGFLVSPKRWDVLAEHMETMVLHPAQRVQLATHFDDLSDFTFDAMMMRHLRLYETLESQ